MAKHMAKQDGQTRWPNRWPNKMAKQDGQTDGQKRWPSKMAKQIAKQDGQTDGQTRWPYTWQVASSQAAGRVSWSQSGERRVVRPCSPPVAMQDLITSDTSSMYSTGISTMHTCTHTIRVKDPDLFWPDPTFRINVRIWPDPYPQHCLLYNNGGLRRLNANFHVSHLKEESELLSTNNYKKSNFKQRQHKNRYGKK